MLGDLVSAGLGVQGMSWVTSPAATELEQHVMDWFAELLGLPESFRSTGTGGGVVQDSSSGRQPRRPARRPAPQQRRRHRAPRRRARPGHRLRLGRDALLDGEGGPHRRAGQRRRPHRRGRRRPGHATPARSPPGWSATWPAGTPPCWSAPRSGTTSTTAVDPLAAIGPICQKYGAWLHVDAAYAGVSAVVPELRGLQDGVEWADSYTTDPHKWLLTGFDATLFWVADRAALTGALAILPEYLRNAATDAGAVVDYRDWQVPLGRRFRALKLWFVLRWYGAEGLRAHIRGTVALAQELAGWAEADERFDVVTPAPAVAGLPPPALADGRRRRRRHHDAARAAQRRRRGVPDPHHRAAGRSCCGWPSARPPPPARTSSGCGRCCARTTTGWPPTSPSRPPSGPRGAARRRAARAPSGPRPRRRRASRGERSRQARAGRGRADGSPRREQAAGRDRGAGRRPGAAAPA